MTKRRRLRSLAGGGIAAAVCLTFLVAPAGALAAAGWLSRDSGTTAGLNAVAVAGARSGWTVGTNGVILNTTDGGATWASQSSGVLTGLSGVAFADVSDGWVVGANGVILHTTDGGATWASQSSGVLTGLSGVAFADANDGWTVGANGVILHTTDGGATWASQSSGVLTGLSALAFTSADDGCAVGTGGVILHTTDGGATWTKPTSPVTADLAAVAFASAGDGWAVGAAGHIVATTDGGATWASQTSHASADLASVAFATTGDGWAVGAGGAIVATTDGGVTWAAQASGTGADLAGTAFFSDKHGLAVGAGGVVAETLSAGVPDASAPVTTATGLQPDAHTGWRNTAQPVTLSASDAGSGVTTTYYVIDGKQKTYVGPFQIAAAGSHTVSYWSVDAVGNIETTHTAFVNIDTGRPACLALADVQVKPGKVAKFPFRVNDPSPSCGKADVTIKIYRGRVVAKTITLKGVTLRRRHVYSYRVKLARGAYTWVVRATDIAGNVQIKAGRRSLRVVNWVIHTTADVQRCLIALDYLPSGAVTGIDDYRTQQALMAFQAWTGLTRDGDAGRATRAKLELASPPKPRAESASGHYAEIFRSLGVLLCVNNGKLVRVVHCSTGRPSLPTPAGHFSIFLKSLDWWSTKYLDWMPFASFFSGGDAIHGYPDVPAYPASHGCCRISMPEAPWVYTFLYYGAQVYVY